MNRPYTSAPLSALAAGVLMLGSFHRPAAGQCRLEWLAGDPIPVVEGNVHATTVWDPDGAGPLPPVLVVGGNFGAGTMYSTPLATWDGTAWSGLGAPPMSTITALAVYNGALVAAGDNGGAQVRIASWTGTAWTLLGTADTRVNAMAVFNGNLFVGGAFLSIDTTLARSIAQWNGTAWSEPGGGLGNGEVMAMAAFGGLYVGGDIQVAGGVPVGNMAIWNGTSWASTAFFDDIVTAMAVRSSSAATTSFLFAGGHFTLVGTTAAGHIAQLSASTNAWTAPPALPGPCTALHVRNTGTFSFQLHAGVESLVTSDLVWRLNGAAWTSLGGIQTPYGPVAKSLSFFNGQMVAGLRLNSNSRMIGSVQLHDGTAWAPATGPGLDGSVLAMTTAGTDVVIGGEFKQFSGTTLNGIARGGPGAWQPLGGGVTGGAVDAVCTMPNGDIIAGGDFGLASGTGASNIARWNGTTWSPLGAGTNAAVRALLPLPGGELIVGGSFTVAGGVPAGGIARWDGASWSALAGGSNGAVFALARDSLGRVIAAGDFTMIGNTPANRIAVLVGTVWQPLGVGVDDTVSSLTVLPSGDIVAGGSFHSAGGVTSHHVARYSGGAWVAQSTTPGWNSPVLALAPLPDGDYVAGGGRSIFNGIHTSLARHDGATSPVSWDLFELDDTFVRGAVMTPNGDLVVGGSFRGAAGVASHNVARVRNTCRAVASSYGAGCVGAGGQVRLNATHLPWLGNRFTAVTFGVPGNAVAVSVFGLQAQSIPIVSLQPQGLPGCDLLASLDALQFVPNTPGGVVTGLTIANTPALIGLLVRHQVVTLELNGAGALTGIASSNGLVLRIGVF